MTANNFETLFGQNVLEDAGMTSTAGKKRKPKLVSIKPAADPGPAKEGDTRHLPVKQIVVERQHRQNFEEIAELASSIEAHGLIQPLLVRYREDGKFELVAGERRLRAVKLLGLTMVPCVLRQLADGEVAALQLAENLNRKDLNPIEEAQGFRDVIEKNNLTRDAVAKMYGRNKSTVSRSLQLLDLPVDVQEQIAKGELKPGAARELARLPDEQQQREALKESRHNKLTTEETRKMVQSRVGNKRKATSKHKTLNFDSQFGKIAVTVPADATYHHIEEALKLATEDVVHRIKNRVSL